MMLKNRQALTKNDFWTLSPPTPIRVAGYGEARSS